MGKRNEVAEVSNGKSENSKHVALSRVIRQFSYESPIPSPHLLAEYEKIVPGSAERIIAMAEKQSDHRRGLEKNVIQSNIVNERTGMNYAFILTCLFAGIGALLLFSGKDLQGFITLISVIGVQTANFYWTKRKEHDIKKTGQKNPQVSQKK